MPELAKAQANTKSKHRTAAKLKGSITINPLKVYEAITSLKEAAKREEQLRNKVVRVTENLVIEKDALGNQFEGTMKHFIAEYVVRIVGSKRRALSAWESVRVDVRSADVNEGDHESCPIHRRRISLTQSSQIVKGDSWCGDRTARAQDIENDFSKQRNSETDQGLNNGDSDEEATLVDAHHAANLIASYSF